MDSRKEAILNVAEAMARQGGYRNFSFRGIAKAIGIKSSSVHYHYSTKEELGAALAKRYTERFLTSLGEPKALKRAGRSPLAVYVQAFRNAIKEDRKMCLCGLLGAETDGIPKVVAQETRSFFQGNIRWLEGVYSLEGLPAELSLKRAIQTLAVLEGAMIACKVLDDFSVFDHAAEILGEFS